MSKINEQFYAITKSDNSFIVSGQTMDELNEKLEGIRKNHPDYYKSNILNGYYIVKAGSVKEAKASKQHISFDLPLFKSSTIEFQIFVWEGANAQALYKKAYSNLQEALNYFRERPDIVGEIRECDGSGELLKTFSHEDIRERIAEQILEEKRKRHRKQLRLF